MAVSKAQIKKSYPLPSYCFQVELYPYLGTLAALVTVKTFGGSTWSFSEVSGLDSSYDHQLYRDGMSHAFGVELMRGLRQPVNITLRRGVVRNRGQLAEWMQTGGLPWSHWSRKKNLRIVQVDEKNAPLVAWTVIGAMPVKLHGPNFKASDNEVAIEALELVAEQLIVDFNPLGALI
jgi:phage tail-like protein